MVQTSEIEDGTPAPVARLPGPDDQPAPDPDLEREQDEGRVDPTSQPALPRRTQPRRAASQRPNAQPDYRAVGRCDPCVEHGPTSRCDRRWPSCGQCIQFDTSARCYGAQEDQEEATV
ncbi:hypothetical protein RSOL_056110, partial [Rhizoctonia solani AG-3 Rhs1AP]